MQVRIETLLALLAVGLTLCLLAGFGGEIHPAGDSLAVFRRPLAALLATVCLIAWALRTRRYFWFGGLVLAALCVVSTTTVSGGGAEATSLRFYQKNLSFRLADTAPLVADIHASEPDIVFLQEVSPGLRPLTLELGAEYPQQVLCPFHPIIGDVAVLSRWPVRETRCAKSGGLAAARIETPHGALWAVSLHLHWPWPYGQASHVEDLLPTLSSLDGPVVLGGDFNMVAWGASVGQIEAATGTKALSGPWTTLPRFGPLLPLPIDHLLVPPDFGGGALEPRGLLGSDHVGLIASVPIASGQIAQ